MRRVPDAAQLTVALALIAGLTAFKLTAGQSVTVIDFLFVPVVGVGWFGRRRWLGYVVAAVAAVDSVLIAMIAETHASLGAAVASGVARFGLYLVVLGLLGMMRRERAGDKFAAVTDRLTGAANSRGFAAIALREVERSKRTGQELSLAFLDVDDFKSVNDRYGHAEGDQVLARACHVMRSTVRSGDTVARIGGDEFAILIPGAGSQAARAVVDRVCGELDRVTLSDGRPIHCSVGLVSFGTPPSSLGQLIAAADDLMYRAKSSGKGRIATAEMAVADN